MRVKLALAAFVCAMVFASQASAAVIFSQDFESGLGGNESTGGSFVINGTGFGNNGTLMMGHASAYGNDEYSFYQVVLDLTGSVNSAMSFDYRGSFETHFDRFNVQAAIGAVAPPGDLLSPTGASTMQYFIDNHPHQPNLGNIYYDTSAGTGGASGVALFDLSAFDNQANVNLRFQFGSDGSVIAPGFNMDNLQVTADSTVPEPTSLMLLGSGVLALSRRLRRRREA